MGLLDRWVSRFLKEEPAAPAVPPATPGPADAATRPVDGPAAAAAGAATARASAADPQDEALARARKRLSVDAAGRAYAESAEFQQELRALDGAGRGRGGDALLADALLASPSIALRRQLAERLLHRGERARARTLLSRLSEEPKHGVFAWQALGELAEGDNDVDAALFAYEQVLALDVRQPQARARVRRLLSATEANRGDDGRRALARFLGARAAGSRYAVVDEIGRGGAATVFRARDRISQREVALKIFHARGGAQDRRARILQEARIAGAFDHPHIVPILDVDESRDLLVMSLCDGGSVQRRIQKEQRLRSTDAVEIGAVLLRTLHDVHLQGRAHLDVKPSNLLFHEGQLMLCDFGSAGLRETGTLGGTRAYMSPEQRSTGDANPRADLYAAGLVIAECIEGRLPSVHEGVQLQSIAPGPRRRALERVLGLLTATDPAQRPRDGTAAAELLLEAGALPLADKDGAALFHHIEALAAREGDAARARMAAHPLVRSLVA